MVSSAAGTTKRDLQPVGAVRSGEPIIVGQLMDSEQ